MEKLYQKRVKFVNAKCVNNINFVKIILIQITMLNINDHNCLFFGMIWWYIWG